MHQPLAHVSHDTVVMAESIQMPHKPELDAFVNDVYDGDGVAPVLNTRI